jgi:hypothetical protein
MVASMISEMEKADEAFLLHLSFLCSICYVHFLMCSINTSPISYHGQAVTGMTVTHLLQH